MSGSATKGHLGKTVFGNDKNGGREAIPGGRKLQEDRFNEFDLANARPMPRTSVDVRCIRVSHSLAISCKALLSMSAVFPHDVEAVFCKLFSHYTYAVYTRKISTNTPTKVIKERECAFFLMLECRSVHNLKSTKGQGPVS